MKKQAIYLILTFLLVNIVIANDFYDYEEVQMGLSISGEIEISPTSTNYNIDYIKANLLFYPQETWRQKIISSNIEPDAALVENSLKFEWNDVKEEKLSFKTDYIIKTDKQLQKIKKKNKFPITNLQSEYTKYTKPTANIDSDNKEIIKLASSLVEGEDDLYIVANKIASWIEDNIKYNLNTLTEDVSQKASWVLINKFGVCDELTTLFIAMLRSLGIPARFVSGMAYTDYNNLNDWGPHAWAEVYFPDYGWVPFDITYRQFGFIDLSHISLMQSTDSDDPSSKYEWKGHSIEIQPQELDIKINLKSKKEGKTQLLSLRTNIFKDKVGFGSYNLVEAEVKNLNDYYVSTEIYLSKPDEIELATDSKKHIILKPNEIKKTYWLIKVNKELDEKYEYTFPIGIRSLRNASSVIFFASSEDGTIYTRNEMQEILDKKEKEEEKVYSKNIDLICNTSKKEFYLQEQVIIDCNIKNMGNTILNNINICLGKECQTFNLGISQEEKKSFSVTLTETGSKENIITVENNEVSKIARVGYIVIDKPKIEISNLEYPDEVAYNDKYGVKFKLFKISETAPQDIIIEFKGKNIIKNWKIDSLSAEQEFILNLVGKDLNAGKNQFQITVTYKDNEAQEYTEKESFYINLTNLNFLQRIIIFFKNII